jgi:hypothetical protein
VLVFIYVSKDTSGRLRIDGIWQTRKYTVLYDYRQQYTILAFIYKLEKDFVFSGIIANQDTYFKERNRVRTVFKRLVE